MLEGIDGCAVPRIAEVDRAVAVTATVVVGQVHAGIADVSSLSTSWPSSGCTAATNAAHLRDRPSASARGPRRKPHHPEVLAETLADDGTCLSSGRPILAPRNETNVIVGRITSSTGSPSTAPARRTAISFSTSSCRRVRRQPGMGRAPGLLIDVPAVQRAGRQGVEQRREICCGGRGGRRCPLRVRRSVRPVCDGRPPARADRPAARRGAGAGLNAAFPALRASWFRHSCR